MIIERNMKQAKRMDNGEMIQGYLWIGADGQMFIRRPELRSLATMPEISSKIVFQYEVDPATVEDIAVKPIEKMYNKIQYYVCPNCEEQVCELMPDYYCGSCGQRIDWSE